MRHDNRSRTRKNSVPKICRFGADFAEHQKGSGREPFDGLNRVHIVGSCSGFEPVLAVSRIRIEFGRRSSGTWWNVGQETVSNCQATSPLALARIHSTTSSSSHATIFADTLMCFGNAP